MKKIKYYRFGPDVAEYLIDPLVRGICAGDCREISVNFLLKDLKETEMKSRSIMLSTAKKLFMKKKSEGLFANFFFLLLNHYYPFVVRIDDV